MCRCARLGPVRVPMTPLHDGGYPEKKGSGRQRRWVYGHHAGSMRTTTFPRARLVSPGNDEARSPLFKNAQPAISSGVGGLNVAGTRRRPLAAASRTPVCRPCQFSRHPSGRCVPSSSVALAAKALVTVLGTLRTRFSRLRCARAEAPQGPETKGGGRDGGRYAPRDPFGDSIANGRYAEHWGVNTLPSVLAILRGP
jgi:hypothetical protein